MPGPSTLFDPETRPGLTLEREPSIPRVRGPRADVAGFVGIAARGPLHTAVRVVDWPGFTRVFGGPIAEGWLAHSVRGFFDNRGSACWVVRIADAEAAAAGALDLVGPNGQSVRLQASSAGTWARTLRVRAARMGPRRFSLWIAPPDGQPELWPALTFDYVPSSDTADRRVATILAESRYVVPLQPQPGSAGGYPSLAPLTAPVGEAALGGGDDGLATLAVRHFDAEITGSDGLPVRLGLEALVAISEISIVAVPDLAWLAPPQSPERPEPPLDCRRLERPVRSIPPASGAAGLGRRPLSRDERRLVRDHLVAHCRRVGRRIAVLDPDPLTLEPRQAISEAAELPDDRAAYYWPYIVPVATSALGVPRLAPSGHVAGVYSRVARERGVHTPPANEPLEAVAGLDAQVDAQTHGWLNSHHVNLLTPVAEGGIRIMGARTLDRNAGSLRFVNVRRLLDWLENALERACQTLPFEPNAGELWADFDRLVRSFVDDVWRAGMLDGATAEEAYSVDCSENLVSPAGIDRGEVVCLLGIRPPWPAEFVRVRLVRGESGLGLEPVGERIDA